MKHLILFFFRYLSIKQQLRRKKRSRTHISDGQRGRRDRSGRQSSFDRQIITRARREEEEDDRREKVKEVYKIAKREYRKRGKKQ